MAMLDYQASNEVLTDFTPVPSAWYLAQIVASEVAPTKNGLGSQLKLTWLIMDGEHQGRKVFDRVTLQNANAKAMEIGRKQLNTICQSMGVGGVGDSTELHDRSVYIDVRYKPAEGQYGPQNEVKNYKSEEAFAASSPAVSPVANTASPTTPVRPAAAQPVVTTPVAVTRTSPPWARK